MTVLIAKDDGFTLAEAMMSLLVVGLALGGLIQVASQSAKAQARIGAHQKQNRLIDQQVTSLKTILAEGEPTAPGNFIGRTDYLSVRDQARREHLYRAPNGWDLGYISEGEMTATWPRQQDENLIGEHPRLEAVILSDAKGMPVTVIKMRLEQPVDCRFDMISRRCREVG